MALQARLALRLWHFEKRYKIDLGLVNTQQALRRIRQVGRANMSADFNNDGSFMAIMIREQAEAAAQQVRDRNAAAAGVVASSETPAGTPPPFPERRGRSSPLRAGWGGAARGRRAWDWGSCLGGCDALKRAVRMEVGGRVVLFVAGGPRVTPSE